MTHPLFLRHTGFTVKDEPLWFVCVLVTQSCLTLFDSSDCSPPGSSVYGILEARILEWVAISFSNKLEQLFFCNDCEVNPGRKMLQLKWKKIMDLKLSDGG